MIDTVFIGAQVWNQPGCVSADGQRNVLCLYRHTLWRTAHLKGQNCATCKEVDGTGNHCAKINQTQKDKYWGFSHTPEGRFLTVLGPESRKGMI